MYANRYAKPNRIDPAGLTAAIAINAAVVAALIFSAPTVFPKSPKPPLTMIDVFVPEPPPPEPVPPTATQPPEAQPIERFDAPVPPLPRTPTDAFTVPALPPLPAAGPVIPTDPGPLVRADPLPPTPLPALIDPAFDPRYAGEVQPIYPAAERRAGHEGRVTVRVLVGVDGRVKRIERVGATSDAFWQVTRDRALARWRFKPGTRGGIPVEAWRTLSLTFVLEN
ncbi:MAG: energy transducer TonB [Pseudomonadota bacterium]|nr:energy transducer TonB [Pseudomonadota bacterium]